MFERYVDARHGGRRRRWIQLAIAVSAVAHVGVGVALVVSAWWKLDKLSIDERPVALASVGFATAAPPPLASESRQRTRRELTRTRETTQPTESSAERPDDGGHGAGSPDGHADGIPGGEGTDPDAVNPVLGCAVADCLGDVEPPKPRAPEPPEEPAVVPEAMLQGYLIDGDTQIQAPRTVKLAMTRQGQDRVIGVVKLCIDEGGRVSSSKLLRSTGHPSYDRELVAGVRRWRYRPYEIGGDPVAVCTAIKFVYILHR